MAFGKEGGESFLPRHQHHRNISGGRVEGRHRDHVCNDQYTHWSDDVPESTPSLVGDEAIDQHCNNAKAVWRGSQCVGDISRVAKRADHGGEEVGHSGSNVIA